MTTQPHGHDIDHAAEIAPVDVEFGAGNTLLERIIRAVGPLAGGLIIDYVDLVTFGPYGVPAGLILGFAAGYWVSRIYGFSSFGRAVFATLAAVYCALPLTNVFPLATIIAAVARFSHDSPSGGSELGAQSSPPDERNDDGGTPS